MLFSKERRAFSQLCYQELAIQFYQNEPINPLRITSKIDSHFDVKVIWKFIETGTLLQKSVEIRLAA